MTCSQRQSRTASGRPPLPRPFTLSSRRFAKNRQALYSATSNLSLCRTVISNFPSRLCNSSIRFRGEPLRKFKKWRHSWPTKGGEMGSWRRNFRITALRVLLEEGMRQNSRQRLPISKVCSTPRDRRASISTRYTRRVKQFVNRLCVCWSWRKPEVVVFLFSGRFRRGEAKVERGSRPFAASHRIPIIWTRRQAQQAFILGDQRIILANRSRLQAQQLQQKLRQRVREFGDGDA